jgi:glutamine synthetase
MEGIKKKIDPGDPVDVNIYHMTETERKRFGIKTLPASLQEALEEWQSDPICTKVMGKDTAEKFTQLKTQEWKEYAPYTPTEKSLVTQWEINKYLYN